MMMPFFAVGQLHSLLKLLVTDGQRKGKKRMEVEGVLRMRM